MNNVSLFSNVQGDPRFESLILFFAENPLKFTLVVHM